MNSMTNWPSFSASDMPLDQLVKLTRFWGSDIEFVIAGGGNTSLKDSGRLFVKSSGVAMAAADGDSFVEMDRKPLADLLHQDLGNNPNIREERFKQAVLAARIRPEKGQRPSVECMLHNMLPRRFVIHTHPTVVNQLTCSQKGESLARELFGDRILWIPYVDPGFTLAKTLSRALLDYTGRIGEDCPSAVLMQNHGLIVCADTPEGISEITDGILSTIRTHLASLPSGNAFGPICTWGPERSRCLVETLGPALRALLAQGEALKVVTFDDSDAVLRLAGSAAGRATALGGPLTPDQIVYCNSFPMWFEPKEDEDTSQLVPRLRQAVEHHCTSTRFPPLVVLVQGLGLFVAGDDFAQANTVRLVYSDAIKVMSGALRLGGVHPLAIREREFIENWEAEAYRRKAALSVHSIGKASGKVAVITGAAQGFGLEIALDLAAEGAHVVLADVNAPLAQNQAETLTQRLGPGRAMGLAIDVTEAESIAAALYAVVRTYGGFDLLVSNAGVLRAGSVKSQAELDFDMVTEVNYKGYFLCVQKSAPIMAMQHLAKRDYWSDIIQINSKSGLIGSNRNGAYAGSKFGGIGLTQSFAMELVEDGIKVNAICPGNFFDGPLWSDPDTGLFVQYLRTGKVPGAKTVQDVRRAYEAKIPMGRGFTTADVMNAVYYLMAQKYEIGQALPVTGGQVMLS
jgi:rhamnose utilization protein RhaD (predicted bifunctional aldolase and dehydrogenase)/NAD(P)-dependent dehydrogenase (short-subunit alcohol dehydrogenase family)